MRNKYSSLVGKIALKGLISLGFLLVGLSFLETYYEKCRQESEEIYDATFSRVEKLADYDDVKGMSPTEWESIYKRIGVPYDPVNPKKLTQENLDNYLKMRGLY